MTGRLEKVLDAIDDANAADPMLDDETPAALLYGRRMSAEVTRLFPDASDFLRIAARGQHIERWKMPRGSYPDGRAGYLAWRRAQAAFHADRVAGLMADAGYEAEARDRVSAMLRKEGIKRDAEVQRLEDVICMVFLRHYFAGFAAGRDPEALGRIVTRTARKMSADGRASALAAFDLPAEFAAAFTD